MSRLKHAPPPASARLRRPPKPPPPSMRPRSLLQRRRRRPANRHVQVKPSVPPPRRPDGPEVRPHCDNASRPGLLPHPGTVVYSPTPTGVWPICRILLAGRQSSWQTAARLVSCWRRTPPRPAPRSGACTWQAATRRQAIHPTLPPCRPCGDRPAMHANPGGMHAMQPAVEMPAGMPPPRRHVGSGPGLMRRSWRRSCCSRTARPSSHETAVALEPQGIAHVGVTQARQGRARAG